MDEIKAKNKSAAFHIYGDLCEVRNYGKIIANLAKDLDYIYFKAQPKQDCPNEIEYVLPIDEIDQNFNLQLVHNLLEYINKQKNDNKEVKKLRLGISSVDFTTIYYDFSTGLDSPFCKEQLAKFQ